MIPGPGMPHPWWMLWQIGDFVVMATLVGLFLRYVLRSNRSAEPGEAPRSEADEAPRGGPDDAPPESAGGPPERGD